MGQQRVITLEFSVFRLRTMPLRVPYGSYRAIPPHNGEKVL